MADTLVYIEEGICQRLSQARQMYELDMLAGKGFSDLFYELFMTLNEGCNCSECQMGITAMESNIIMDIDIFRPQLLRLKNEYPQLFGMHEAFFSEVIRTRDPERMLHPRVKKLSKMGFFDSVEEDDDYPAQQPVRREGPKIGRNDPCPCGSGKKYKKCCGV